MKMAYCNCFLLSIVKYVPEYPSTVCYFRLSCLERVRLQLGRKSCSFLLPLPNLGLVYLLLFDMLNFVIISVHCIILIVMANALN